jgi:hypothetical protein
MGYIPRVKRVPMNTESPSRSNEPGAVSRRLRTALALHESGVAMRRAQLRAQDRAATTEEIERRLAAWLRARPGAPLGDAEGIARTPPNLR